jgi:signal transduction histidine kinase
VNHQRLNNIFALAAESTRKVNEIIWAINPANDTLEHFVRYLGRFAERHLQSTGIRLRFDAPDAMPDRALTSIQRHNLYLAAKEAIHNAVKHSGATELSLRIRLEGGRLEVRITDNGRGFVEPAESPPGRGSANMQHRMEQIGGTYRRVAAVGAGTIVDLTCPVEGAP